MVLLSAVALGVCPSHPSLRGEGEAGRCEAAGSKKPEVYSLEYIEDCFRAENDADASRSFAAVEWHDSNRLLDSLHFHVPILPE